MTTALSTTVFPSFDVAMLAEVHAGLTGTRKTLPSKYFYDHRGSELFEEITLLPEYYPTRTERGILEAWMPELAASLRPRTLVELGAGSGEKTRLILDAMREAGSAAGSAFGGAETYVPIDVSEIFLRQMAARFRAAYPGLAVRPAVADIGVELGLPDALPGPVLFAFLGSTIGNFSRAEAAQLLGRVRAAMRPGDRFLLGVDLRKDRATVEAAYNDARGVTAEFNRNILRVLNCRLGADFDPSTFDHLAFYRDAAHRIEMHLVSRRAQTVTIPAMGPVAFAAGETIRTEISCKYDREAVEELFADADLALDAWRPDPRDWFALALGAPV